MAAEFEALSRIPFRPLSYENVDLAFDKELIADYDKGNLYMKDAHGNIIDLSQSISKILVENNTFVEELKVTITNPDGSTSDVQLTEQIVELTKKMEEQQKVIEAITSGNGGGSGEGGETVIIKIVPGQVVQDADHQFMNDTQLEEISNKVSLKDVIVVIPKSGWAGEDGGPYTQTVSCMGATSSMARPTVDLDHSTDSYATAKNTENEWPKIYRAVTGLNTITFYAKEVPTLDFRAVVQMKLTGLTKNTEIK